MRYFLFLDESGDHGLSNIDKTFPVFVLCGIIISDSNYNALDKQFDKIKKDFWGNKKVIFHSRDIRKCEKEFKILLDNTIKQKFYSVLDKVVSTSDYVIISSAIHKEKFIRKYGKLQNDVYEIALSFIIERSIFYFDSINKTNRELHIIIEKRGRKEDNKLRQHLMRICSVGTFYVAPERLKAHKIKIHFRDKLQNINGLQLSDLIAYPIARYALDPKRANPAFDIFQPKFYKRGTKRYGLKIFP